MKQTLNLIKIGGNIIDDETKLNRFLKDFAQIPGPKILIHGGGKTVTQISGNLGLETTMVNGLRITDAETLRVVTMVYGGLINKTIVAKLQAEDCNAIGFTGADANLIPAAKRAAGKLDFGYAGDIIPGVIRGEKIAFFLDNCFVPVFAPLTHDKAGSLLNTNADTIASALAIALSGQYETKLYYCFEKNGVLTDLENEDSIIEELTLEKYRSLKHEGLIAKGMLPKLDNAFKALVAGVNSVVICHADAIGKMLIQDKKAGTELVKE
ncbi:acetylglutamate kinase [Adhaeribacter sp. BT258]|uniref:Acetylglutamate kinase n=1 Tax=Adhaeribacter terrigena TaxID=2793070 RepID=A0ABS1C228_9BACT|nr:acetylglutamate kinase [Adhaeribacter terrigena]MBK0402620.1 acetylglutamate kinase [Adhaeribacter terrigena]